MEMKHNPIVLCSCFFFCVFYLKITTFIFFENGEKTSIQFKDYILLVLSSSLKVVHGAVHSEPLHKLVHEKRWCKGLENVTQVQKSRDSHQRLVCKNAFHDAINNNLRLQDRKNFSICSFKHSSVDKVWTDTCSVDTIFLQLTELQSQRFVETNGTEFGCTVISQTSNSKQTSRACNGDNVSMIMLQHEWKKSFCCPKVCDRVDFHHLNHHFITGVKKGFSIHDSSIVYQNSDVADLCSDGIGSLIHEFSVCNINSIAKDLLLAIFLSHTFNNSIHSCLVKIPNDHTTSKSCKCMGHQFSNATCSTSNNNKILRDVFARPIEKADNATNHMER
eukprot:m.135234 g.135234  ORF g.135234 m.135234 type:complete len:333 (-) comp9875_c0_seq1:141-1139(-)